MNRLDTELHRLYLPTTDRTGLAAEVLAHQQPLTSADGQVRALVLGLARPADWDTLARVWQGVQADLGWPAPAIAVSGTDGHQLWFSLAEPVPLAQAAACVVALQQRYLGDVRPERVLCWPPVPSSASSPAHSPGRGDAVARLPGQPVRSDQWSAWVTPDLARIFEDEPWLDLPPGADAQADVISRLKATPLADVQRAMDQVRSDTRGTSGLTGTADVSAPAVGGSPAGGHIHVTEPIPPTAETPLLLAQGQLGPRRFLLQVMNDPTVDMQWRIEAAKVLLPHVTEKTEG